MVAMDVFAHAFGLDSKSDDVWTTLGKVTAVSGNTLSVLLGGSATPTECEAYCVAGVGDIVFVAISKGQARAIACKGGGDLLPLSGGTITGDLEITGQLGLGDPSTFRDEIGIGSYGSYTGLPSIASLTTTSTKLQLKDFSGHGCEASANGIKVHNSGLYMLWGGMYLSTGFTANDLVHVILTQGGTVQGEGLGRAPTTNPYATLNASPVIVTASAGDVFYLYAYNQTASRGTVADNARTCLCIKQIG